VGGRKIMSTTNVKTLAERHDNLRQECMRVARHMKLIAAQDRKEAEFAELKALKELRLANATFLEGEGELLMRAAKEI
jgi:hypothetical protein